MNHLGLGLMNENTGIKIQKTNKIVQHSHSLVVEMTGNQRKIVCGLALSQQEPATIEDATQQFMHTVILTLLHSSISYYTIKLS